MAAGETLDREWLSAKEIKALTGFGGSTIYEALASGELRSIRKGRAIRVRRADLDAWMSESSEQRSR